jgi:hypothetical protein
MKLIKGYIFIFSIMLSFSCVEEIDLKMETEFESALVVEATITNEEKVQEVVLSRTYKLDQDGPYHETNANVKVIDANGIEHDFQETSPGKYQSLNAFAAQSNIDYAISITTQDGRKYASNTMKFTQGTQMDELFFERGYNENNFEGVSVFVNSYDPTANSNFYRFKYEEAYKIIAPSWTNEDIVDYHLLYFEQNGVPPPDPIVPRFGFVERPIEEQICYKTNMSNSIIIASTNNLVEDRLDKFRVLFLNRDNYIITHRYSILVSQYVQSVEAHTFYKTLSELSESESILSETQPGFLSGNLFSVADSYEKVLGFFEVVAADTQRIYFNYDDLFSGEQKPSYAIDCEDFYAPSDLPLPSGRIPLTSALIEGTWKYYQPNDDPVDGEGPYDLVSLPCGDCTFYGISTPPIWWEE